LGSIDVSGAGEITLSANADMSTGALALSGIGSVEINNTEGGTVFVFDPERARHWNLRLPKELTREQKARVMLWYGPIFRRF
jgi:hypothetical protein